MPVYPEHTVGLKARYATITNNTLRKLVSLAVLEVGVAVLLFHHLVLQTIPSLLQASLIRLRHHPADQTVAGLLPIVSPAQSHLTDLIQQQHQNQRHITMMCLIIACLLPANPIQSHLAGPPAPGLLPSVSQHEHNLLISKTGMNCLIMAMAVALEAAVEVGEVLGLRIEYNR